MKNDRVVAIDIETTGFKPGRGKILEIGAVALDPATGKTSTFSTLVTAKERIPKHITELTGISRATLLSEGSLGIKESLVLLWDFINKDSGRPLLVGHNLKKFDIPFICYFTDLYRLPSLRRLCTWDTMLRMREELQSGKRRIYRKAQGAASIVETKQAVNLKAACDYYGVDLLGPGHRALTDAQRALGIYRHQARINNK